MWTSDKDGQVGTGGSFTAVLSDGSHTITATATDSGGKTGSDNVNITVGTVSQPTSVIVDSISYATEGGKSGDQHLLVTVALMDDLGGVVSGAVVSIQTDNNLGQRRVGTATAGTGGTVTFSWKNAASTCYNTAEPSVTAGLNWDGTYPANQFCK